MPSPPNVLWIYCDELRTDALNCYGNRFAPMHTPNLDWLAEHGVRFDNCFCNSPVCVPSRVSTMTGQYPEQTGVYHNEAAWGNFRFDGEPPLTFPEVFATHGYQTANFGKLHLARGMQPWHVHEPDGGGMRIFYEDVSEEALDIIQPPGVPTQIGGRYPVNEHYPPERVLQNAIRWMQETSAPYLARVSLLQPHTPVFPKPPYDTLYAGASFPKTLQMRGENLSRFEQRWAEILRANELSPDDIYRTQVAYYGLVAWIDGAVGKVLDVLRKTGQLEHTIIVFGADHGASLGENGSYAKQRFAPEVHRVPCIIAWSGSLPSGKVRADICEGLDLPRTLFALAGIESPASFGGRDLFGDPAPDAVYATIGYGYSSSRAYPNLRTGDWDDGRGWPRRACIRTAQYRLDKNVRQDSHPVDTDVFLVDVQADPDEGTNLANEPHYIEVATRLNAQLDAHIAESVEPPEAYVVHKR